MATRDDKSGKLVKNKFSEKIDGKSITIEANRLLLIIQEHHENPKRFPWQELIGAFMGLFSLLITVFTCSIDSELWRTLVILLLSLYLVFILIYVCILLHKYKNQDSASCDDILEEINLYNRKR